MTQPPPGAGSDDEPTRAYGYEPYEEKPAEQSSYGSYGAPYGDSYGGYQQQGQPAYGQPVGPPSNDPLAVTSLVLGICSLVGSLCCSIFVVLSAGVGIVLGFVALSRIAGSQGQRTGRGMAIAGLVCSVIAVLVGVGFFVLALVLNGWSMYEFNNV